MPGKSWWSLHGSTTFQERSAKWLQRYDIVLVYIYDTSRTCCCYTGQQVVAYEDAESRYSTIRHSECEVLLPHTTSKYHCSKCTKYRKTLRTFASWQSHREQTGCEHSKSGAESHVNYRYLTVDDKDERLRELHTLYANVLLVLVMHNNSFLFTCVQCNGKEIWWSHLQNLYHHNSGAKKSAGGLSLVPKLTYEHIYLTSFSKMRVDLAVQVSNVLAWIMYMPDYMYM